MAAVPVTPSTPTSFQWELSLVRDIAQLHSLQQQHMDTTSTLEHIAVDIVGIIQPGAPGLFGLHPAGSFTAF